MLLKRILRQCLLVGIWVMYSLDPAFGQLTELSSGDSAQKWLEAQSAALSGQLADRSLSNELRMELAAQQKWLDHWKAVKLSTEPLWTDDTTRQRLEEPVIDPQRTVVRLRQRLLGEKARPSIQDTKTLERLLAQRPNDVGVRQLHLHWLDQRQYRKTYPREIAGAASKLVALLDQMRPQSATLKTAKAFTLYRRGRALVYRELPEVVEQQPIEDRDEHSAALLGTYKQLKDLVGAGRPEFILLEIRMLRRDHWYGRALAMLESNGASIDRQWFLKKRRDILQELGWEIAYSHAASVYAAEFPEEAAAERETEG